MMREVRARSGAAIRLTDERWAHISEEHCELAGMREEVLGTVENPERVLAGVAGELLALGSIEPGKVLVVVYKEVSDGDGFVITAFLTRRLASLERRSQVWPKRS
jgi:hypothetical protein